MDDCAWRESLSGFGEEGVSDVKQDSPRLFPLGVLQLTLGEKHPIQAPLLRSHVGKRREREPRTRPIGHVHTARLALGVALALLVESFVLGVFGLVDHACLDNPKWRADGE